MIKYFCDICEDEIKEHGRVRKRYGQIRVEIISAYLNIWDGGNLCHKCIIEAVNKGVKDDGKCAQDEMNEQFEKAMSEEGGI